MFLKFSLRSMQAAIISCAIASGAVSSLASANEKITYGAVAVDISKERGALLRERQSASLQTWRERAENSREAFLKRLEERRKARVAALRSVKVRNQERSTKRYISGRGEEDGAIWSFLRPRKERTNKETVSSPAVVSKGKFGTLIAKYAKQHGVPYELARAVVQVESTFRPNVTGQAGEIGLMQIKLSTARGMGYKGSRKQLYNPATNLYWGMKYLGRAHQLAGGSTCGTILRYNAGHAAKRMNKVSSNYCRKVKRILA